MLRRTLLALVVAMGCADTAAPERPIQNRYGAFQFDPPEVYGGWWAEVERCSGKTGDFAAVRWFEIPNADYLPNSFAGARSDYATQAVVVAGNRKLEANVIRHEALHLILKMPGHPPEFFGAPGVLGKCMTLVE